MAHFYLLDSLESTQVGERVILDGAEGRHAATVSRVRVGEVLTIGNGRGLMLTAEALSTAKDSVELRVDSVTAVDRNTPAVILVQALAKTDRDERAIESCTELGIDSVIPWAAERSVSKWEGPKIDKGIARWVAIVREATKQSIRPYLPTIRPLVKSSHLPSALEGVQILVLDPNGDIPLSKVQADGRDIAIVVGPEGGISDKELELLRSSGASIVTLGANILRTSTAGPAALAILNAKLERC